MRAGKRWRTGGDDCLDEALLASGWYLVTHIRHGRVLRHQYDRLHRLSPARFLRGELRWRERGRWEVQIWADLGSDGVHLFSLATAANPLGLAASAAAALDRYEAMLRLGWLPGNQGGG